MKDKSYLIFDRDQSGAKLGIAVKLGNEAPLRSSVAGFSKRSGWRMVGYLMSARSYYRNMVTLTYPDEYPDDPKEYKIHLDKFLVWLVAEMKASSDGADGVSAFWFLEYQQRGAPHYHIFTTDYVDKAKIAAQWAYINKSFYAMKTMTRVEKLRGGHHAAVAYAAKYARKMEQKDITKAHAGARDGAGRWWGVRGDRRTWSAGLRINGGFGAEGEYADALKIVKKHHEKGAVRVTEWTNGKGVYLNQSDRKKKWFESELAKELELWAMRKMASTSCIGESTGETPMMAQERR